MKDFRGRVAVVTGAASGIGLALAREFADERMHVVLADIDADALRKAEQELRARGAQVLAVETDVSRLDAVENLARRAIDAFGPVHILCNNAGVDAPGGYLWDKTPADWQWVFGVNVWGTIHGLHVFVPRMLAAGQEGHIVNTASVEGFLACPFMGPYRASKHAIVSISETLHCELATVGARLKVSVLCPDIVQTRIREAERNRPAALANPSSLAGGEPTPDPYAPVGMSPDRVAARLVEAIRDEQLYVLTSREHVPLIQRRADCIVRQQNPSLAESRESRYLRTRRLHETR